MQLLLGERRVGRDGICGCKRKSSNHAWWRDDWCHARRWSRIINSLSNEHLSGWLIKVSHDSADLFLGSFVCDDDKIMSDWIHRYRRLSSGSVLIISQAVGQHLVGTSESQLVVFALRSCRQTRNGQHALLEWSVLSHLCRLLLATVSRIKRKTSQDVLFWGSATSRFIPSGFGWLSFH